MKLRLANARCGHTHENTVRRLRDQEHRLIPSLYGANWGTISDAELVYLIPTLCRRDAMQSEGADNLLLRLSHLATSSERAVTIVERMKTRLNAVISAELCSNTPLRVSLSDAIDAAWVATFNSAYIYTEHAYAHETLTAAAWLGLTCVQRQAVLPADLAEPVLSIASGMMAINPTDLRLIEQGAWAVIRSSRPLSISLAGSHPNPVRWARWLWRSHQGNLKKCLRIESDLATQVRCR
jgi:hypothetical protein